MEQNTIKKIRNIGIVAHIDAGKTTTTERILFFSGITHKMGEVHNGEAVMDFMKQEQERGITISSAAVTADWKDHKINIIDTPGHIDFTLEVERSLRVLDGMIMLLSAADGVQPQSETVWHQADRYKVPRIAFVNKMDMQGADFFQTIEMMDDMLGANSAAFQIPMGKESDFEGIIDLVNMRAFTYNNIEVKMIDIPEAYLEISKKKRDLLIEKLSDFDDNLLEKYLNEKEITVEDIKIAARYAILHLLITPVFCGSAFKNKGVRLLLDAVVDYLPSPLERGVVLGYDIDDNTLTISRKPSYKRPFSALSFKIINDPYVGQQTFIRAYSGELNSGSYVYNSTKQKRERVGRILRIRAKEREDVLSLKAGDIGALIGMKFTTTGDTLCDEQNQILLENIHYPETVIDMKVEPESIKERDKLGIALSKMTLEDPSFKVRFDNETEETVISGMGELHLDVIVDRLKTEHKLNVKVGEPSVAFRETITREIRHEYKYKKQTGGHGQYAHIDFRIEPNSGKGIEFIDNIFRQTLEKGLVVGFPMLDVKFILIDGGFHPVDSSEMAFRLCTNLALKEVIKKSNPELLEPIMKVEINTPDEFMGDIIGDINRRRGKINNMRRYRKGAQKLSGFVPLMEMFGYASVLRTLSSGRANYSMEFYKYHTLPKSIKEKLVEKFSKEKK
jgi:elongation factor G